MSYVPSILVAAVPWGLPEAGRRACANGLRNALREGLGTAQTIEPSFAFAGEVLLVDRLTTRGLCCTLEHASRGSEWAVVVMLRPPPAPVIALRRLVPIARRRPAGVLVRPDAKDPAVHAVDALLQVHVALLRGRTDAAWRTIDARRRHPTHTATARELRCSVQSVSRQVRHSHMAATDGAHVVLDALLRQARAT